MVHHRLNSLILLILGSIFPNLICNAQGTENNPYDIVEYSFRLELNDTTNIINGQTLIKAIPKSKTSASILAIQLNQKKQNERYGMMVHEVKVTNRPTKVRLGPDIIEIPIKGNFTTSDTVELVITYSGEPADGLIIGRNKFGARTFFGDNWPNRAHHWLPTIDHPSDKAICEFIVEAPAKYDVIANGALKDTIHVENGRKVTHWKTNVPIPTKVMVIGVADFEYESQSNILNTEISSWVFPENMLSGFRDYAHASEVFQFFLNMFGSYPFTKLAHVQSKTRFGGMENAGNIFYYENSVTGKGELEGLIAHETAHQWFGNSLSEKHWEDVWLSEGFATYLTHMYIEAKYGSDKMRQDLLNDKKRIKQFNARHPGSSIIPSKVEALDDLLNPNSYEKASWFLHMLRQKLGDELFMKVITTFYNQYALSNANTDDFLNLVNDMSTDSYGQFFDQWLRRTDIPDISYSWKYMNETNEIHLELTQRNQEIYMIDVELEILLPKNKKLSESATLSKQKQTFIIKTEQKPLAIIPDPKHNLLADFSKK